MSRFTMEGLDEVDFHPKPKPEERDEKSPAKQFSVFGILRHDQGAKDRFGDDVPIGSYATLDEADAAWRQVHGKPYESGYILEIATGQTIRRSVAIEMRHDGRWGIKGHDSESYDSEGAAMKAVSKGKPTGAGFLVKQEDGYIKVYRISDNAFIGAGKVLDGNRVSDFEFADPKYQRDNPTRQGAMVALQRAGYKSLSVRKGTLGNDLKPGDRLDLGRGEQEVVKVENGVPGPGKVRVTFANGQSLVMQASGQWPVKGKRIQAGPYKTKAAAERVAKTLREVLGKG